MTIDPSAEAAVPAGSTETFGMTDLEEALMGPASDQVRRETVERLESLISKAHIELERGVPSGQLEPTQRVYNALATARGLMIQNSR